MIITGARYEKGELRLQCSPPDGVRFVYEFKADNEYDITLRRTKKKRRSLNANSYAWVLIDQIAAKVGVPPEEVYRRAIRDTGGVSLPPEDVPLDELEAYIRKWVGDHLGRQVKLIPSYSIDNVTVIRIKGSSDYDTSQMARFIDGLIQEAETLEIETKDPGWVQSLLDKWGTEK